jgi:hypothetical protein
VRRFARSLGTETYFAPVRSYRRGDNKQGNKLMRTAIILATIFGIGGVALAADGPTMQQCKAGWKSNYSQMWSKEDFKKACADMMKNGKM